MDPRFHCATSDNSETFYYTPEPVHQNTISGPVLSNVSLFGPISFSKILPYILPRNSDVSYSFAFLVSPTVRSVPRSRDLFGYPIASFLAVSSTPFSYATYRNMVTLG